MGCPFSSCKENGSIGVCGNPNHPLAIRMKRGQWEKLVECLWWQRKKLADWLRRWWQGDNEPCDIERCDNEHGDNEQSDGDHIYEQKVQILVEMGFPEDDVRGALNENGCNEFLALLMLCAQNTNTK